VENRSVSRTASKLPAQLRAPAVFVLVFLLLNVWIYSRHESLKAEKLANLMTETSLEDPNEVPRRDRSCGENLPEYWRYIPDARQTRLAYLVGMSQQHAIYQRKQGDHYTSELLDDALAPRGVRVYGLAAPNLDNEEALLYLLATASSPATHPSAFIYGLCFDKFRNVDLRPKLQAFLHDRPELVQAWRDTATKYVATYPAASRKMLETLAAVSTPQNVAAAHDTFEAQLRAAVARVLPVVDARTEVNALIQNQLYETRNWVLGIKSSTKRPIIQARYDLNREFLGLLSAEARARGIAFLPYVIPLNPVAENPYVESEYSAFKDWYAGFSREHEIPFVNLERLVPSREWGVWHGGPDFKHFDANGHRRTAAALAASFGDQLSAGRTPK
jgi:hypothetical protein